jgi:hypothetical protein
MCPFLTGFRHSLQQFLIDFGEDDISQQPLPLQARKDLRVWAAGAAAASRGPHPSQANSPIPSKHHLYFWCCGSTVHQTRGPFHPLLHRQNSRCSFHQPCSWRFDLVLRPRFLAPLLPPKGSRFFRLKEYKWTGYFLGWTRRAGTIDIFSCHGCSSQPSTKYYFPHRTLFHLQFISPHCPATWADRRSGSPVSLGRWAKQRDPLFENLFPSEGAMLYLIKKKKKSCAKSYIRGC